MRARHDGMQAEADKCVQGQFQTRAITFKHHFPASFQTKENIVLFSLAAISVS